MTKSSEVENKLKDEFPYLYRYVENGVSIGEGWYPLIRELSTRLEPLMKRFNQLHPNDPVFTIRVKEKFGMLRYYIGPDYNQSLPRYSYSKDDEFMKMYDLISDTEVLSGGICEFCGKEGDMTDYSKRAWIKTLCTEHTEEWYNEHKR